MCKRIVAVVLATLAAVATVAALAPRAAAQSPFGAQREGVRHAVRNLR